MKLLGPKLLFAEVFLIINSISGFPDSSVVKNLPTNSVDMGLIPGFGRSPGEGNAIRSSILAWEIPWIEEPGWLQSFGLQRVR